MRGLVCAAVVVWLSVCINAKAEKWALDDSNPFDPLKTVVFGETLRWNNSHCLPKTGLLVQLRRSDGTNLTRTPVDYAREGIPWPKGDLHHHQFQSFLPVTFHRRIVGKPRYIYGGVSDRGDGTFLLSMAVQESGDYVLNILVKGVEIPGSPILLRLKADACNCPQQNKQELYEMWGCDQDADARLVLNQLRPFVDPTVLDGTDFSKPEQVRAALASLKPIVSESLFLSGRNHAFVHYTIKDGKLYGVTTKEPAGIRAFFDPLFLSLLRHYKVPDMEILLNLSDYPALHWGGPKFLDPKLVHADWVRTVSQYVNMSDFERITDLRQREQVLRSGRKDRYKIAPAGGRPRKQQLPPPVFSGSKTGEDADILMPTHYFLSSIFSTANYNLYEMEHAPYLWKAKKDQMVWRGSDSSRERHQFVRKAQEKDVVSVKEDGSLEVSNPDYDIGFHVVIREPYDEAKHGRKKASMGFTSFFNYRYLANVDGSVAAYRLPFLFSGGSLVLWQRSPYLEYNYDELLPFVHYVPFDVDFSDLHESLAFARSIDREDIPGPVSAEKIAAQGRIWRETRFRDNNAFCYMLMLLDKYSKLLDFPVKIRDDMKLVEQPVHSCTCDADAEQTRPKDEL